MRRHTLPATTWSSTAALRCGEASLHAFGVLACALYRGGFLPRGTSRTTVAQPRKESYQAGAATLVAGLSIETRSLKSMRRTGLVLAVVFYYCVTIESGG